MRQNRKKFDIGKARLNKRYSKQKKALKSTIVFNLEMLHEILINSFYPKQIIWTQNKKHITVKPIFALLGN